MLKKLLLLLLLSTNFLLAQETITYTPPTLIKNIFDLAKVSLKIEERKEIASAMGVYLKEIQLENSKNNHLLASKMLGIALRLDDKNKEANIINSRLKRGLNDPQVNSLEKSNAAIIPILEKYAKKLNLNSELNDRTLALYLYEIILVIDQKKNDVIYEIENLNKNINCDWSWAVPIKTPLVKNSNDIKKSESDTFYKPKSIVKNNPSFIKTIITKQTLTGKVIGEPLEMGLVYTNGKNNELVFQMDYNHEIPIQNAHNKAKSYIITSFDKWQLGEYYVTFSDNYFIKDRNRDGTGAAFCILLLSIFEGFKIDQRSTIIGDIKTDGVLISEKNSIEKIRTAIEEKYEIVCIPKFNIPSYYEYLLIDGNSSLQKINVFSINQIESAKKLISTEKDPVVFECISKYKEICQKINFTSPATSADLPNIKIKLEEIRTKLPTFENVNYLLSQINNTPLQLSLETSFENMFSAIDKLLPFYHETCFKKYCLSKREDQSRRYVLSVDKYYQNVPIDSDSLLFREYITEEDVRITLTALNSLSKIIHPKLKVLNNELINFVGCIDRIAEQKEKTKKNPNSVNIKETAFYKKLVESRSNINKLLLEFKDEAYLIERLIPNSFH